jgi:hypothetical protein
MLFILLALLALLAANTNAIPTAEPSVYEVNGVKMYELPADADLSHPAFNIEAMIALREKDPTAPLPQVPGLPDLSTSSDTSTSKRTVIALPPPTWSCTTNTVSPPVLQILANVIKLAKIGESWCCMTTLPCTTVVQSGVAASNICNYKGHKWCIQCKWIAAFNLDVGVTCGKGNPATAAGRKE